MSENYAYNYAYITDMSTGECLQVEDSTDYVLLPHYVPIPECSIDYLFKYYWPLPTTVTSHDDFHGLWYEDAEHTILAEGLN